MAAACGNSYRNVAGISENKRIRKKKTDMAWHGMAKAIPDAIISNWRHQ